MVLNSEPTDDVQIDLIAPSMVTLSTARLTFTPSNWNVAQTVTATAVDDAVDNTGNARSGNITHTVVAGESDYDGVTAVSVAVTVTDDDTAPEGIALTVDEDEIAEDAGKTSVTVTATVRGATRYAAAKTVTVTVGKSTDSAESGVDYAAVTAFDLELGAGEASVSKAFDLTPTDDALDETDETISVTGESGSLSVTGASITLTDNDDRGIRVSPVTLTLAEVDDPLTESATEHQKTYTVELDSQPTGTVTVNLASGDTKIATLSDTSLEFTASDWDAQTVTVTAVADDIDNAGDARTVRITHTVSAADTDYKDETAAAVEVTVTDDDGEPTLSIDSPSVAEGDSSTATMTFKVTLSPASGKLVTVAYADATTGTATSATDYAAITDGTLNFAVGQTEKTVDVTVNGDTTDEPNETVVLRLSSPSNAALSRRRDHPRRHRHDHRRRRCADGHAQAVVGIHRRVRRRQLDHGDRFPERRIEPGRHPDGRRHGRVSGRSGRLHAQRHDPHHRGRRYGEHRRGDHHRGGQRCGRCQQDRHRLGRRDRRQRRRQSGRRDADDHRRRHAGRDGGRRLLDHGRGG